MLKHIKYIMSAIFAFISDAYSQDSRWVYAGTSDEANYYYDSRSVLLDGDVGRVDVKFIYVDAGGWEYCIARYRVFLSERMLCAAVSHYYDREGNETEVLSDERAEVLPETPEEVIFNVFMERAGVGL